MIKIESSYFFVEYYTDKYIFLIPITTSSIVNYVNYVRLFKSNGITIGAYNKNEVPDFIMKLKDPEYISSEEELDYLIDRFLKLKAFL